MKLIQYSDLYRMISGMKGAPTEEKDFAEYYSCVIFLSARARAIFLEGNYRNVFGNWRSAGLRLWAKTALKESIEYLLNALRLFPEEGVYEIIEKLIDMLFDIAIGRLGEGESAIQLPTVSR